ncbi:carbamate kinase [Nonomuraea sp. NN258]|uniref:carbamate kinase n=1 Tax=Nonomuraea antri TaxID=2730852 RepID=UPI001568B774|nr:carbamate kinase [Nonomuraea antri]NRQ36844.1 carbamate kinase [Nonomuraea antri]
MRIVIALGGNALLVRGQRPDAALQQANTVRAVRALAPLAEQHELVITHGNGPQVGLLALESAANPDLTTPYPFDVLGAQTQGMIGYWLLQALENALPGRAVVSLINQTLVSAADQAFTKPTKFVGPGYDERTAQTLAQNHGWSFAPDGDRWRRVVPSPEPHHLVETRIIRELLTGGAVVVCAGGGGVPVVRNEAGKLEGVEAVIDKDLATAKLAESLEADALLLLTDVAAVLRGYGTPAAEPITRATPAALRRERFAAGSMGPKVEAICRFVEVTGSMGAIGALGDVGAVLAGMAGTVVTPGGNYGSADDLGPRSWAPARPASPN